MAVGLKAEDLYNVTVLVGNYSFACLRSTMEKYPESPLAKYLAPKPSDEAPAAGQDSIRIDRDGSAFHLVLEFMNTGKVEGLADMSRGELKKLANEANYYCLDSLESMCQFHLDRLVVAEESALQSGASGRLSFVTDRKFFFRVLKRPVVLISYETLDLLNRFNLLETVLNTYDGSLHDLAVANITPMARPWQKQKQQKANSTNTKNIVELVFFLLEPKEIRKQCNNLTVQLKTLKEVNEDELSRVIFHYLLDMNKKLKPKPPPKHGRQALWLVKRIVGLSSPSEWRRLSIKMDSV